MALITWTISLGELLVALGTLALAGITWRLARTTSGSVEAAQASADAERASVEAMAMPYVVLKTMVIAQRIEGRPPLVKAVLLNIGSGPAIVTSMEMRFAHEPDHLPIVKGLAQHIPIPSGEDHELLLPVYKWPTGHDSDDGSLVIEYLHSNGDRYATRSHIYVNPNLATCFDYPREKLVDG